MKKALFVDCLIRGEESRTKQIVDTFLDNLNKDYEITHLKLVEENLKPLVGDFFTSRQELLDKKEFNHPRFRYANELANADLVIIGAPFWDLSFPSLLKIYIENCSVDGITFYADVNGLHGLCKGSNLVYITSRGGIYDNTNLAQDIPYLKSLQEFFGFKKFDYIAADGMDVNEEVKAESLNIAKQKAIAIAKTL